MATVYLAEDLKRDRKVTIDVLEPELAAVLPTCTTASLRREALREDDRPQPRIDAADCTNLR
jgi:hypothetical protein